jgi:hypothetical protein
MRAIKKGAKEGTNMEIENNEMWKLPVVLR